MLPSYAMAFDYVRLTEMFRQTLIAIASCVVQRWINLNRMDVDDARENRHPRHLAKKKDGPCPSQRLWPI